MTLKSNGTQNSEQPPKISQLKRREIQAPIAACLIRGFITLVGREEALAIATAAIQADALAAGKTMAEKVGTNSLSVFAALIRNIWAEDDAITLDVLEETDQIFNFNVTRCRYVETYEQAGMKDLGYCLSCSRDESFARGFNPRIRLTRTGTIMQGEAACDFRFLLEQ